MCQSCKREQGSGIDITPEMLKAGEAILPKYFEQERDWMGMSQEFQTGLLTDIFKAMLAKCGGA